MDEVDELRGLLRKMEARPRTVLCVCGSRSLEGGHGEKWGRHKVEEVYRQTFDPHRDIVLTGGASGPDVWARELLPWPGRPVEYLPSGVRLEWVAREYRDWGLRQGRWSDTAVHPLARNEALCAGLVNSRNAGWKVGVICLIDPRSRTQGTRHMARLCREAKLAVLEWHFQ